MDLFEERLESLKDIIAKPKQEYTFESQKVFSESNQEGALCVAQSSSTQIVVQANMSNIQQLFGTHKFSNVEPFIGPHPDFEYLKNGKSENYYAVSMFADIKGSTKLVKRYDLQTIKIIKETILSLVIEVCSFFGGHIQRLQGDGAFVYFVRKEMNEKDAIINSLNASSLLAYLIENKIKPFFNTEGVESPEIRIGIDYGNTEETLWSYYGVKNCKELTTTGLHTDLAVKLQTEAEGNGIMIGENIVKELDLQENLLQVKLRKPEIFDNYKMFQFNCISIISFKLGNFKIRS